MTSQIDDLKLAEDLGTERAISILHASMGGTYAQRRFQKRVIGTMAMTILSQLAFNDSLNPDNSLDRAVAHSRLSDYQDVMWVNMRQHEKDLAAGECAFVVFDEEK